MAQWTAWRIAAEPYFKLLGQPLGQFADSGPASQADRRKQLLVAGQLCTTVLRLQEAPRAWAETPRKMLIQLAGRMVRPDRPVPAAVLMEGLDKFFVLLDALEIDAGVAASPPYAASARG
jgi:flagellar biosynthesis protein FlhF